MHFAILGKSIILTFWKVLNRLDESVYSSKNFVERQLSSHGGRPIKLVSFKNALELVMVLPGKIAKETRKKFCDILKRYMAGDQSMHDELDANAKSDSPIAQMARESLQEDYAVGFKRRRENLDLIKYEEEIRGNRMHNLDNFMGLMSKIRPDWMQTDARLRLHTEDMIKNVYSSASLVPAGSVVSDLPATISISQMAMELGCPKLKHGDQIRLGRLAAKRWKESHPNMELPEHPQWVDGAERGVKSYTTEDRDMLAQVFYDLGYAKKA